MRFAKSQIAKHLLSITGIIALSSLCMVYPFLPGEYDQLAMPVSILVQVFGAIGLPLSIIGILWLLIPGRFYAFATVTLFVTGFIILVFAMFALFAGGKILGMVALVIGLISLSSFYSQLKMSKKTGENRFTFLPVYLVLIPVLILIIQLLLAKPITNHSRNLAIKNAAEFISDLDNFHAKYGYYQASIQAMHKDYNPGIAGIEKYHYLQYGDSYNLSFEQPRFFFDVFGTREWVVYNPKNEHRAYSHTASFSLYSPEALERSQGWYTSGGTDHPNWKYFYFD